MGVLLLAAWGYSLLGTGFAFVKGMKSLILLKITGDNGTKAVDLVCKIFWICLLLITKLCTYKLHISNYFEF